MRSERCGERRSKRRCAIDRDSRHCRSSVRRITPSSGTSSSVSAGASRSWRNSYCNACPTTMKSMRERDAITIRRGVRAHFLELRRVHGMCAPLRPGAGGPHIPRARCVSRSFASVPSCADLGFESSETAIAHHRAPTLGVRAGGEKRTPANTAHRTTGARKSSAPCDVRDKPERQPGNPARRTPDGRPGEPRLKDTTSDDDSREEPADETPRTCAVSRWGPAAACSPTCSSRARLLPGRRPRLCGALRPYRETPALLAVTAA